MHLYVHINQPFLHRCHTLFQIIATMSSSSSSGQGRPAREGVPCSSPRLRERRRLEQEQELQSQDEEEKEDDDANEDASDDEIRADASGGSLIGVSQLLSRNNGSNSSRHNASETVQRVTKRTTVGINSRRDQPPKFPKKTRRNLQSWGQQFRLNEVMSLLDTVLTHLPIGSHEWECVASEHNENFPDKDRTGTSIRRKFAQLNKVKMPTGDPTCPAEVRYFKQVFRKKRRC